MPDIEERLRAVKAGISAAALKRARAEGQAEMARASVAAARARLREEFGVTTPEEAKEVRSRLEAELERAISEVERSLERTTTT
jgi:hypothetical protein